MEQNQVQKYTHTNLLNLFFFNIEKEFNGGSMAFSTNSAEVIGSPQQKNKPQPKSHTLHKNYLKMHQILKCKT